MSDRPQTSRGPSFAVTVSEQKDHPIAWKTVLKRAVLIFFSGLAIYLLFPAITEVLASWPRLSSLDPIWFTVAIGAEVGHFICTIALQRLALRSKSWFPVVTSQLAGNSITNIIPGGAAIGAAVQFRMLETSGQDTTNTVGALTAFSLLGVGGLLALPVFALPVILVGAPVNRGLVNTAIIGAVGFILFAGFSVVVFSTDSLLRWCGLTVQWLLNRIHRKKPPLSGLDGVVISQRDLIRGVLGKKWHQAVLLSTGRLALDYVCLLGALRATGSHPRPSVVMVAYAAANILSMIPITPGGLGIVESSLTGLLVLAGVNSGDAALATLGYRLASYWVPLIAGPIAYLAFRIRYRGHPRLSKPALA